MALVLEKMLVSVVSVKSCVRWRSANPAQRSTRTSPLRTRENRAPSSSPLAKLASKASRTA